MSSDVTIGFVKDAKTILMFKDSMYIITISALSHFGGSGMLLEVMTKEL